MQHGSSVVWALPVTAEGEEPTPSRSSPLAIMASRSSSGGGETASPVTDVGMGERPGDMDIDLACRTRVVSVIIIIYLTHHKSLL
jgi:hypothetical protein